MSEDIRVKNTLFYFGLLEQRSIIISIHMKITWAAWAWWKTRAVSLIIRLNLNKKICRIRKFVPALRPTWKWAMRKLASGSWTTSLVILT